MLPWLGLKAEAREVVTMHGSVSGWHVVLDVWLRLAGQAVQWSCWPQWLAVAGLRLSGRQGCEPLGLAPRGSRANG